MKRAVIIRDAIRVQRQLLLPEGVTFLQVDVSDDGKSLLFVVEHSSLKDSVDELGLAPPALPVIDPLPDRIDHGRVILRDWGYGPCGQYTPQRWREVPTVEAVAEAPEPESEPVAEPKPRPKRSRRKARPEAAPEAEPEQPAEAAEAAEE